MFARMSRLARVVPLLAALLVMSAACTGLDDLFGPAVPDAGTPGADEPDPTTEAPGTDVVDQGSGGPVDEAAPGGVDSGDDGPLAPGGDVVDAGAGCGLVDAVFCDTFDASQNGGTQTGDLDPVVWGVSRVGDINPTDRWNGISPSHNGCERDQAVAPPADVRICAGQLVESVNDGGSVVSLHTYPKQPFDFEGRTGTVVFDVSADAESSHAAWPEFVITDKPVPGVRAAISGGDEIAAANEIGFTIDGGCLGRPV